MWRTIWVYRPEVRYKKLAVTAFLTLPLDDKPNDGEFEDEYNEKPFSRFDGPEWTSFLRQWGLGAGVRYGFGNR
jgi:hypothetical protein